MDLLQYASQLRYGELHVAVDEKTGLKAIVALHNLKLGPAIGGCRCIEYPSSDDALRDAMRLARGMTYKAAISGLPHGEDDADSHVFHAGTTLVDGNVVTAGGRVLCVTALGDTVRVAQRRAYEVADRIRFDGCQMRRDIGFRAIGARRSLL